MRFRIIEKGNPRDPNAPKKFYASPVNIGMVDIEDFAAEIELSTSLTRGDILNVLDSFIRQLPIFLKMGASVRLANFAILRLTLSSEGTEVFEDFSANNIKGVRVAFAPSRSLKNSLLDISFEREKE